MTFWEKNFSFIFIQICIIGYKIKILLDPITHLKKLKFYNTYIYAILYCWESALSTLQYPSFPIVLDMAKVTYVFFVHERKATSLLQNQIQLLRSVPNEIVLR